MIRVALPFILVGFAPSLVEAGRLPLGSYRRARPSSSECRYNVEQSHKRLKKNGFNVARTLKEYLTQFPELRELLSANGKIRHWIDLGAGLGIAAYDAIHDPEINSGLTVTLVGVEIPPISKADRLEKKGPGYANPFTLGAPFPHYVKGYLHDVYSQLDRADIITDFFGAWHYTNDLSGTAEQIFKTLKVGGVFVTNSSSHTTVSTPGSWGNHIDTWLRSVKGIEVLHVEGRIVVRRISEEIVVPPLMQDQFSDASPPTRKFLWPSAPREEDDD